MTGPLAARRTGDQDPEPADVLALRDLLPVDHADADGPAVHLGHRHDGVPIEDPPVPTGEPLHLLRHRRTLLRQRDPEVRVLADLLIERVVVLDQRREVLPAELPDLHDPAEGAVRNKASVESGPGLDVPATRMDRPRALSRAWESCPGAMSPNRLDGPMKNVRPAAALYSLLFFLGFGLAVLMLATDKNLQTDFGTVHSGYFVHWYVIAALAAAELVGGLLLVAARSRLAVKAGVVGSGLLAAILLGGILTYQEVGFKTATLMAQYLFGITYYGGNIRYLFDALLAVLLLTMLVGIIILAMSRHKGPDPAEARKSEPVPPASPANE